MPTNPATGQRYATEPWMAADVADSPTIDPIDALVALMTGGVRPALQGLLGLGERGAIGAARPVAASALADVAQGVVGAERPAYVPALRQGGRIWRGSVGDTHGDLAMRKGILDVPDLVSGWVDTISGEFTTHAPKGR